MNLNKTHFILSLLFIVLLLGMSSCSMSFYQVYNTTQVNENISKDENEDLKITYNFWSESGSFYFEIYNKTDNPIYIDFDRSHYIYNGFSSDYFSNEETTISTGVRQATNKLYYTNQTSIEKTTVSRMKREREIPPHSSISYNSGTIYGLIYRDCTLKSNPGNKKNAELSFDKYNSPMKFDNYITYSKTYDLKETKVIQTDFFVDKIINMTSSTFHGKQINDVDCNNKTLLTFHYERPFKKSSSFYNTYLIQNK